MGHWAKQARAAISQKNYTQAGDFYKMDGAYRSAVKAYLKGENYVEAAQIYEETGLFKKAEGILQKHGRPKDLAEFYIRRDDSEMATNIYLNHGMNYEAAELLENRDLLGQAAILYDQLGFHEKAGILYGKTKNFDRAIEMFSKVIQELEESDNSNTTAMILKYHGWIANLHIGAKRFNKAGEIFEEIQQKEKAAKCYAKGGNAIKAARILMDLGKPQQAQQMLEASQSLESRMLQGEIAMERSNYREAITLLKDTNQFNRLAEAYEHLGEFRDAAFYLEKAGDLPKSAAMYAKERDYQKAALLFEQNGLYEEAAQNYEKQKKYGNAAKFYHIARNRYKAGLCLYKLNRLEDALKQLQLVGDDHPNYQHTRTIQAEIFFKQGVYSVSRKLLEDLTSNMTLDDNSMSVFYLLARCLEEVGDIQGARNYYDRIVARRFDYSDVRIRLKRLQSNKTKAPAKAKAKKTSPFELTIGDLIADRFRIIKTIGKGGMGSIFKVRDQSLDRDIALKMLLHERGNFEDLKGELLIARDLTHPYIIKVFDVGQWMGIGYFTMECVDGQPLKEYIRENDDPLDKKIDLLIKICAGLKAAHDQNIVHRDIKPHNIMIDGNFNPKILDFGIARKVASQRSGSISGSPKYMAPEQIQNFHSDLRTDIYAMGIIMFYMFTRKEPFLAKTPQEVMLMHLERVLPEPFTYNANLPFWLCDIIKKCCQKSPDMRYNDMQELIDELKSNQMEFD